LITGENASGKTSLLEGIYYLGRGRSFRSAGNRELMQTGRTGFSLFGEIRVGELLRRSGVEVTGGERRIRVDGEAGTSADLVRALPVQAIDPEIHELVQGGPELRRQFLDWGVFHVEHSYLATWRRYQAALKQRNAALRHNASASQLSTWDDQLVEHGQAVDAARSSYLSHYLPAFATICGENLRIEINCEYRRGWPKDEDLAYSLHKNADSDISKGFTQVGPHRADLVLEVKARRARYRVSRGQQKLIAAALVIAQTRFLARDARNDLVLLVDDPAAELDQDNRARLFGLLRELPAQLFITALEARDLSGFDGGAHYRINAGEVASLL
jgi:DNA replication and repair protein RecF